MANESESSSWIFNFGVIKGIEVPGGDLPSLEPSENQLLLPSHSFADAACTRILNQFVLFALFIFSAWILMIPFKIWTILRKRDREKGRGQNRAMCPSPRACREKLRRDRLNDRFVELASILDPGRSPKAEKSVKLDDAVRTVTQLQDEAPKLKESNQNLQEKINELKVEKNELRNEKQKLKAEKEHLERLILASTTPSGFLGRPPAFPAPFPAIGQVISSKLVPFVGYPGVSMWQFMTPAAVDTSEDHVLRLPVA